jgi:hypothetical protein
MGNSTGSKKTPPKRPKNNASSSFYGHLDCFSGGIRILVDISVDNISLDTRSDIG